MLQLNDTQFACELIETTLLAFNLANTLAADIPTRDIDNVLNLAASKGVATVDAGDLRAFEQLTGVKPTKRLLVETAKRLIAVLKKRKEKKD